MKHVTLAIFLAVVAVAFHGTADESGSAVADRLRQLTASTAWKPVREVALQFDAFHPQGMVRINGEFYVSSVEVINRAKSEGKGHIFKIDSSGALVADAVISSGPSYHAGGMDFDGASIWVPCAEYKPASRTVVFKFDPKTMQATEVFGFGDHLGLLVHDPDAGLLIGASWGSRNFYQWDDRAIAAAPPKRDLDAKPVANSSHYIDLQDGKWLRGTPLMLCGGLKGYRGPNGSFALGGLEVVDMKTLSPVHQVPIAVWDPSGRPMLQNAFCVEATDVGLRFYFLPGDGRATIYVYEPVLR